MSRKPLKIEEILEQIGSTDVPGDNSHRYELRRSLLCSRYFNAKCARVKRANQVFAYAIPLFAGTFLVLVFSIVGTSISDDTPTKSVLPLAQQIVSSKESSEYTDDVLVETEHFVSLQRDVNFVPTRTYSTVLTR